MKLATEHGAAVSLLYIIDGRAFLTLADERVDGVCKELRSQGEAALTGTAEAMAEYGANTAIELRHNNPAEETLTFTEEIDTALISMGTHIRSEGNILRGVSQPTIVQSKIPVLATPIGRQWSGHAR